MRTLDRRVDALEAAAGKARIEFVVIDSIAVAGAPGAEVMSATLAGVRYDRAVGESPSNFKARLEGVADDLMPDKNGPGWLICNQADIDL